MAAFLEENFTVAVRNQKSVFLFNAAAYIAVFTSGIEAYASSYDNVVKSKHCDL